MRKFVQRGGYVTGNSVTPWYFQVFDQIFYFFLSHSFFLLLQALIYLCEEIETTLTQIRSNFFSQCFPKQCCLFHDAKCSFVYLDLQERRTIDIRSNYRSYFFWQTYNSSYFSVLNIGMEIGSRERSNRSIDIDADVDAPESAG